MDNLNFLESKNQNIRKPSVEDVSRLAEIHVYGWRHAYSGILPDELLYNQRQVLQTSSMHEKIIQTNIKSIDIFDDGIIRGFVIHNNARESELQNDYEISALYVEPAFLRKGYGTKLIGYAENVAKDNDKKAISLWVLEDNWIGRNFYEKMGYENTTIVKTDEDMKELLYRKAI